VLIEVYPGFIGVFSVLLLRLYLITEVVPCLTKVFQCLTGVFPDDRFYRA